MRGTTPYQEWRTITSTLFVLSRNLVGGQSTVRTLNCMNVIKHIHWKFHRLFNFPFLTQTVHETSQWERWKKDLLFFVRVFYIFVIRYHGNICAKYVQLFSTCVYIRAHGIKILCIAIFYCLSTKKILFATKIISFWYKFKKNCVPTSKI